MLVQPAKQGPLCALLQNLLLVRVRKCPFLAFPVVLLKPKVSLAITEKRKQERTVGRLHLLVSVSYESEGFSPRTNGHFLK